MNSSIRILFFWMLLTALCNPSLASIIKFTEVGLGIDLGSGSFIYGHNFVGEPYTRTFIVDTFSGDGHFSAIHGGTPLNLPSPVISYSLTSVGQSIVGPARQEGQLYLSFVGIDQGIKIRRLVISARDIGDCFCGDSNSLNQNTQLVFTIYSTPSEYNDFISPGTYYQTVISSDALNGSVGGFVGIYYSANYAAYLAHYYLSPSALTVEYFDSLAQALPEPLYVGTIFYLLYILVFFISGKSQFERFRFTLKALRRDAGCG